MPDKKTPEHRSTTPNFSKLETEVLERWRRDNVFQKTLDQTQQGEPFVFFEGPPTANGKPGIHHVIARAFKDVICRYQTMQGKSVERKAGWDTQGLPVELEVEKQLKVSGKKDIEKYGIEKFNQACRESVWKYKAEWEKLTERMGYWLDLEHPYITYEKNYIESLWWIFKQLWDKKLLVKDYKVVPQCPRCETALSSHEVAQGYERVTENSVFVKFRIKNSKGRIKKGDYILSWTTTPWTLPGNVALAISTEIEYVRVQVAKKRNKNGEVEYEHVIIANNIYQSIFERDDKDSLKLAFDLVYPHNKPEGLKAVKTTDQILKGIDLVGVEYEPLFPGAIPESAKGYENAFKVYAADFVTTEEGTGIVHTAVMYGDDDYKLGEKEGLPKIHTVNSNGTLNENLKKWGWEGWRVKDSDEIVEQKTTNAILEYLTNEKLLFAKEKIKHDYPFCWRCHSPLLYYAKDSWFITMSRLKKQLKENNDYIKWIPDYIQHGRFGEWLNEIKDWAVSRERYWGTPLPIWECDKCHECECIGSYAELAERSENKKVLDEKFDPHRPFIDDIKFKCQCGGVMKRVPEVADTWFDSGSMPFAQWHYLGEPGTPFDDNFPADYIAEAIDQTRGWFYTLLAISTALDYKEPPYKNVICLGHVLDAHGRKMSKHIGNVVDPWTMFDKYGADAVRFYFFSVNQPGDVKLFDDKSVDGVVKKFLMILWNTVNFWETYRPEKISASFNHKRSLLDRWILNYLANLINSTKAYLEKYDVTSASRIIVDFVSDFSTWYVRRSRDRFKQPGADRDAAFQTLTECLMTLTKIMAPFTPMVADALYQRLGGKLESVHLEAWPETLAEWKPAVEAELIKQMATVRQIVEIGHSLRAEAGIKVRQPLGQLVFKGVQVSDELNSILLDELNVREAVGAKTLPRGDEWKQKESGELGVALDTTITDELREAGWVREVIRHINDERKRLGLKRTDSVVIQYETADETVRGFFERYGTEISQAVHAEKIDQADPGQTSGAEFKLDGHPLALFIHPDNR